MSGNGVVRKAADVAPKGGKAIDWDVMVKMIFSEEARKEFFGLRRAFEDVNNQLQTKFSQEPQAIDWEYYRKEIGSKVVDMYKEAYEISRIEGSRKGIIEGIREDREGDCRHARDDEKDQHKDSR